MFRRARKILQLISASFFLLQPMVSFGESKFNGTVSINGASGALFIMSGMDADRRALVITNGHVVQMRPLTGGTADYIAPGQIIHEGDIEDSRVWANTSIDLHSDDKTNRVRARRLLFATMTKTDVAVYELELTYRELRSLYGSKPFMLDRDSFAPGDALSVYSGYYPRDDRTFTCSVDSYVDLNEGEYRTDRGIRLTKECAIYTGFSGSPMIRQSSRTISGVVNTSYNEHAKSAACGLGKPCERMESGERSVPPAGTSYGVPTDFLYQCYDERSAKLNFGLESCPHRKKASRAPANWGGEMVTAGDPLDHKLVAIQNEKSQSCSGTFVAKDVVITAAHCSVPDGKGDVVVKPGSYVYPLSLKEGFDPLRGEKIRITKVVIHPEKNKNDIWIKIGVDDEYPFDNPDIALVKLERPYAAAMPARLARRNADPDSEVYFAGFGRGNQNWQRPGRIMFYVLKEDYAVVGKDFQDLTSGNTYEFMKAFGAQFGMLAPYFHFVRSKFPGLQTLCYGDSGGPLYTMDGEEMTIVGVASLFMPHPNRGNPRCEDSYLNVFAKVAPHLGWINSEIDGLSQEVER